MKAMRAHQFGGPDQLKLEDAPEPQAQAGQVIIRVRAAGINPAGTRRERIGSPGARLAVRLECGRTAGGTPDYRRGV